MPCSASLFSKTQADAAKISPTLTRLCEEDMTLSWYQEPATGQTILQGMGDQHIDVAIRAPKASCRWVSPPANRRSPYREGITKKADAMYRHKKQSGGSGQFGEVWLRIEPCPESDLNSPMSGGYEPFEVLPAGHLKKGIHATLQTGVVAGFPLSKRARHRL